MIDSERFVLDCTAVRRQNPLIHNITNYVAMNFTANVLLAAGASPLMSFYEAEMEEIIAACNAVCINLGCLDRQLLSAARTAAAAASRLGKPWVLDPVGAGVSAVRTSEACRLAMDFHPSIIRGNVAELSAMLAYIEREKGGRNADKNTAAPDTAAPAVGTRQRGVDCVADPGSAAGPDGIPDFSMNTASRLTAAIGCTVAASGEVDCITDGKRTALIANGTPLMTKVTAMGCSESAVCAAFAAVDDDPFNAAVGAMLFFGTAGEMALERIMGKEVAGRPGTGSFQCAFLDALSTFNCTRAAAMIKEMPASRA